MNTDELLARAKSGLLSPREVDDVARALRSGTTEDDPYCLMHILGRAGARKHRDLVETYLKRMDDPMMSRLALQILCTYWDDTERYLPVVERFIRRVPEDVNNEARLVAMGIAGEYVRGYAAPRLLAELYRIFRDEREDQIVREAAYTAMARAVGTGWHQLPSAARHFDLERDIDPAIMRSIEAALTKGA